MPAVHVRNLDDAVIEALKRRAAESHRSLEAELRVILEAAAAESPQGSRRRRKLALHTVAAGRTSELRLLASSGGSAVEAQFGRDEIYGEDER